MIDTNTLEHELRRYTIAKLRALKTFTNPNREIIESTRLSTATGASQQSLGGLSSSLIRSRIEGKSLIELTGKIDRNTSRLKLNPEVTTPKALADILKKIGI